MLDFPALSQTCAPDVHQDTMRRIVQVESAFNPYAIGIVGARLARQPASLDEAIATVTALEARGFNYSAGLAQVNRYNFGRHGLDARTVFDPCANLKAGARILGECFGRARGGRDEQAALLAAISCYYSGNFLTGFRHGYVARVVAAPQSAVSTPTVPKLDLVPTATGSSRSLARRTTRTAVSGKPGTQSGHPPRTPSALLF